MSQGAKRISSRYLLVMMVGSSPMLFAISSGALEAQATKGQEKQDGDSAKPLWQRVLKGNDAKRVVALEKQVADLEKNGQFAAAVAPASEVLAIRRRVQGEDDWETVSARLREQTDAWVAVLTREVQSELATAIRESEAAEDLSKKGRYGEAQPLYERALAIRRKTLGQDHPDTAIGYSSLASNLDAQGRYGEAQPLYERALAIWRKALGEDHPDTGSGYNGLAHNLKEQGRYGEAQPLYERALAIHRKALGEDHPDTAVNCNNLAVNLNAQGRYAEAQPLFEQALAIRRKALGEDHPLTAQSYHNVASNLNAQRRYAEAQPL
jgi:tetratricopeptide (TPR) repeat protein